jgi:hypothetical protein
MHRNNTIYKGYRLSAVVDRSTTQGTGGRSFTAAIIIGLPGEPASPEDRYSVPEFNDGVSVTNPAEAVHAAVTYGRQIVDSMQLNRHRV